VTAQPLPAPDPAGIGPGTFTLIVRAAGSPAEVSGAARAAGAGAIQLREPAHGAGLPVVVAVRDPGELPAAADLLRLEGAADEGLLRAAGRSGVPVLLEPAPAADPDAWLRAADVAGEAGARVVLCAAAGAPALDLALVPRLQAGGRSLVVDTAASGRADGVAALARAAAAAGADGVVVDLDLGGGLGLGADALAALARELDEVAAVVGRRMAGRRIRYVGAGGGR
jgi:3-deoxy-7-phosphoheptulonate synthase